MALAASRHRASSSWSTPAAPATVQLIDTTGQPGRRRPDQPGLQFPAPAGLAVVGLVALAGGLLLVRRRRAPAAAPDPVTGDA